MTVSWFVSQNQAGYDLSVVTQNRREDEDDTGHTLKSSGLLHVEASQIRVLLSYIKTGGGETRMMHMISSQMLRQDQVDDGRVDAIGCVGPCYP
jgi:hypothetical protein